MRAAGRSTVVKVKRIPAVVKYTFRCSKSILTTCLYFDNLEFDIFDAGGPQCHSRLLPLQLGFERFQHISLS